MADIVAYNSFQHATKTPFPTVALSPDNPENYMVDAKKRQRVPLLHMRLREPELKRFKQFILDEIEEKKAPRGKD
jgi:hypothetical protein